MPLSKIKPYKKMAGLLNDFKEISYDVGIKLMNRIYVNETDV